VIVTEVPTTPLGGAKLVIVGLPEAHAGPAACNMKAEINRRTRCPEIE
jgi:hypothetical protein